VAVLTDDEGLVHQATSARPGARAALVAPIAPDATLVRMAVSYLASQRITLVATATLLARADAGDSTIALATLPPDDARPEVLPHDNAGGLRGLGATDQGGGERRVR
jgi:hypothetical protein